MAGSWCSRKFRGKQTNYLLFFQEFQFHESFIFSNLQEFVDFVENVRSRRKGSMEPTIVHCSAGIGTTCYFLLFLQIINVIFFFKKKFKGRTGVVILMETALYLIEANQPVYPLDLTRVMRDQRASMIQTPSQYKFVCQVIKFFFLTRVSIIS